MEYLKEVDWHYIKPHPTKFIEHADSFEKCAMNQLLRGTFRDPLLDIQEGSNLSETVRVNTNKQPKGSPKKKKKKHENDEQADVSIVKLKDVKEIFSKNNSTKYIPGLLRIPQHPQQSKLSTQQHELCVKVLLAKNNHCISMLKQKINDRMLDCYNNLIPIIKEEQAMFMDFVKTVWTHKGCTRHFNLNSDHEILIDEIIKRRKNFYKKYPQHYNMSTMLPLVYANQDIPIETEFLEPLKIMEPIPPVKIPSLERKFVLSTKYENKDTNSKEIQKSISEDNNCEQYAIQHQANVVISSNGLKTLATNQDQFSSSWTLPVLVKCYKSHDSKGIEIFHNIAYIDRSLPASNLTDYEKTYACYKHLLKSSFKSNLEANSNNSSTNKTNKSVDATYCEQCISFIKDYLNNKIDCYKINQIRDESKDSNLLQSGTFESTDSEDDNLIIDTNDKQIIKNTNKGVVTRGMKRKSESNTLFSSPEPDTDIKSNKKRPLVSNCTCKYNGIKKFQENGDLSMLIDYVNCKNNNEVKNATYSLWRLGQTKQRNKLSKDIQKDLKVLIRCKQDFFEMDENNQKQILMVAPKLEYQLEFGAEVTKSNEIAHQWTTLKFNPNSKLLRARIKPNTGEIIMIEKLSLQVLCNEALKNTAWKPENALGCFFNIFSKLSMLPPGQYMLNHEPNHHAFAVLYYNTQNKCSNGLDLEEKFNKIEKFPTDQTAPWAPIDPCLVTPNLAHHNIMPAMFNPKTSKVIKTRSPPKKKGGKKKKKCQKGKLKNQ